MHDIGWPADLLDEQNDIVPRALSQFIQTQASCIGVDTTWLTTDAIPFILRELLGEDADITETSVNAMTLLAQELSTIADTAVADIPGAIAENPQRRCSKKIKVLAYFCIFMAVATTTSVACAYGHIQSNAYDPGNIIKNVDLAFVILFGAATGCAAVGLVILTEFLIKKCNARFFRNPPAPAEPLLAEGTPLIHAAAPPIVIAPVTSEEVVRAYVMRQGIGQPLLQPKQKHAIALIVAACVHAAKKKLAQAPTHVIAIA